LDVFFYEAFQEEAQEIKKYLPAGITAGYTWKTIQEYGQQKPPASLISIRTQSIIPVSWANHVAGILSRSTGYDHLTAYLNLCDRTVPCGHLPPYCSRSVAEQAMLLWMCLLRRLPDQINHFTRFNRDGLTGQECEHKTLLVLGVGNIGHEIVRIGKGLGVEVLGVDIVKRHPAVSYVSISEGLPIADIIVCAMNLTLTNRAYCNYQLLKRAKTGAIFVNIARGELSPTSDLLRLLDENHLGGIALDVFDHEGELANSLRSGYVSQDQEVSAALVLAKRPNVICTPHNAFNTREAVIRKAKQSALQIDHFLKHGVFQSRWNGLE